MFGSINCSITSRSNLFEFITILHILDYRNFDSPLGQEVGIGQRAVVDEVKNKRRRKR